MEEYYAKKQFRTLSSNAVRIYNDIKTYEIQQDDSLLEMMVNMLPNNSNEEKYRTEFENFIKNRSVKYFSFYNESMEDTCPGLAVSENETNSKSMNQPILYILLVSPYCFFAWNEIPSAIYYSDNVKEFAMFVPTNKLGLGWIRNCLFGNSEGCNRYSKLANELENNYPDIFIGDFRDRLTARIHVEVPSIILDQWMADYSNSKWPNGASPNPSRWDKMASATLDSLQKSKPVGSISIFGLELATDFLPIIISLACAYVVTNIAHLARVMQNHRAIDAKVGLLLFPAGWYERILSFILVLAPPLAVFTCGLITMDIVKSGFSIFGWLLYFNPLQTELLLSSGTPEYEKFVNVGSGTTGILFVVYLYAIVVSYQSFVKLTAVRKTNMTR